VDLNKSFNAARLTAGETKGGSPPDGGDGVCAMEPAERSVSARTAFIVVLVE